MSSQPTTSPLPAPRVGRFFAVLGAVTLVLLGLAGALFRGLDAAHVLAPTPVSGNLCLDEKLDFVARHPRVAPVDVLAIGSSMTLNNLDSKSFTEAASGRPASPSLLNLGAWAIGLGDVLALLGPAVEVYRPRIVLMVTSPQDFQVHRLSSLDPGELEDIFRGQPSALGVLRRFDLGYTLGQSASVVRMRRATDTYATLAFDDAGGVVVDLAYPRVDPGRWNRHFGDVAVAPGEYAQLRAIGQLLAGKGITFVHVQAPIRPSSLTDKGLHFLEAHWQRAQLETESARGLWLNLHDAVDGDEKFADYSHLNRVGAPLFTHALRERLARIPVRGGQAIPLTASKPSVSPRATPLATA